MSMMLFNVQKISFNLIYQKMPSTVDYRCNWLMLRITELKYSAGGSNFYRNSLRFVYGDLHIRIGNVFKWLLDLSTT